MQTKDCSDVCDRAEGSDEKKDTSLTISDLFGEATPDESSSKSSMLETDSQRARHGHRERRRRHRERIREGQSPDDGESLDDDNGVGNDAGSDLSV